MGRMVQTGRVGTGSRVATLGISVAAIVVCLTATASDGRIPIGTVPYTITAAGSYYLTANLDGSATTGEIISIRCNDVVLDLEGHTILAGSSALCIGSGGNYVGDVRITNGVLDGGTGGVSLLTWEGDVAITHLRLYGQGGNAIQLRTSSASQITIEDNTIVGPSTSAAAILVQPSSTGAILALGGAITRNRIYGSGATGMTLYEVSGVTVSGNTISRCSSHGILLTNCANILVTDNASSNNQGYGIDLTSSNGCNITHNTTSGDSSGVVLTSSGKNAVDWNFAQGGWWGIELDSASTGNVYSYNRTPGNVLGISDGGTNTNAGGNAP